MPAALISNPAEVAALAEEFESASPSEILRWAYEQFGSSAAIGTSFQGAGLVAIHHAVTAGLPLPVFTIDTGLLFFGNPRTKDSARSVFWDCDRIVGSRTHRGRTGAGHCSGTMVEQS